MSNASHRIAAIDGLRGLAIINVVLFHQFYYFERVRDQSFWHWHGWAFSAKTLLYNGSIGVSMFFVLSGFVLALPFMEHRRSMHTVRDVLGWYGRRALRLLPLCYGSLLLIFIVQKTVPSFSHALSLFFFTFIFHQGTFFPVENPVLWSLAVEWWMCLAAPVLLMCMRRWGCIRVLATVVTSSAVMRLVGATVPWIYPVTPMVVLTHSPLAHLDLFIAGMVVAHSYARGIIRPQAGLLCIGLLFLLLYGNLLDNIRLGVRIPTLYILSGWLIGFATVAFLAVVLTAPASVFARMLSFPPLTWVGRACYSIYIWHMPLARMWGPLVGVRDSLLYFSMLGAISIASWMVFEHGCTVLVSAIHHRHTYRKPKILAHISIPVIDGALLKRPS